MWNANINHIIFIKSKQYATIYSNQFAFRQGGKPQATGVYIKLNTDGEQVKATRPKIQLRRYIAFTFEFGTFKARRPVIPAKAGIQS